MIHDRVFTTSLESAKKKGRSAWLSYLPARACLDRSSLYAFTDGSSKGSYAAVFVDPSAPDVAREEFVEFEPPTSTRNMGAEWRGLLLALRMSPEGIRLVVVSDLLWLGAWMVGVRNAEHPETIEFIDAAKQVIENRGLAVRFVHHGGHQDDDSHFTRWNKRADELCRTKAKAEAARNSSPES